MLHPQQKNKQKKPFNLENVYESRSPPLNREFGFLTLKVLKDLCGVQPGPKAGQAPVSDLLPALVRDHLAVLLHDHQLGNGGDLVALLQLTEKERTEQNIIRI